MYNVCTYLVMFLGGEPPLSRALYETLLSLNRLVKRLRTFGVKDHRVEYRYLVIHGNEVATKQFAELVHENFAVIHF